MAGATANLPSTLSSTTSLTLWETVVTLFHILVVYSIVSIVQVRVDAVDFLLERFEEWKQKLARLELQSFDKLNALCVEGQTLAVLSSD